VSIPFTFLFLPIREPRPDTASARGAPNRIPCCALSTDGAAPFSNPTNMIPLSPIPQILKLKQRQGQQGSAKSNADGMEVWQEHEHERAADQSHTWGTVGTFTRVLTNVCASVHTHPMHHAHAKNKACSRHLANAHANQVNMQAHTTHMTCAPGGSTNDTHDSHAVWQHE